MNRRRNELPSRGLPTSQKSLEGKGTLSSEIPSPINHLSQRHIKAHHHYKTDDHAEAGRIAVAGGVGLGNHFFDDHKIMAPAAKARAKGRMGSAIPTTSAPKTAAMGSTMPESCPKKKARFLEKPSPKQRHGYGHALGDVLQPHTEHQGHGPGDAGFGSA